MDIVLTGGKVVTSKGVCLADVYVRGEKIDYIKEYSPLYPVTLNKKMASGHGPHIYDVSGFYILPGLIQQQAFLAQARPDRDEYREIMYEWMRRGFTSFADMIYYDRSLRKKDGGITENIGYHGNSYLDFFLKMRIPLERLNAELIRICGKHSIKVIVVSLHQAREILKKDWEPVVNSLHRWKISLQLDYNPENFTKKEVFVLVRNCIHIVRAYGIRFILPVPKPSLLQISVRTAYLSMINVKQWEWLKDVTDRADLFSGPQLPGLSVKKDNDQQIKWENHFVQLSRLAGANIAKLFGVFPRKGTLTAGSDADLALYKIPAEKGSLVPASVMVKGKFVTGRWADCHPYSLRGRGRYLTGNNSLSFTISPY
ncbi:MAG: hypothetical protein H0Z33_02400 [Bacillaceae bacterium]|nr:hypothetical protein [Bacillaceae bacterium]